MSSHSSTSSEQLGYNQHPSLPHLSSQPLPNSNPYGHPPPHPYYQQQLQQQQQMQVQQRPPMPTPSSSSTASPPVGSSHSGAAALATAAALASQKSRSVMACVLCRKQKMKCEGPDKAPCKRCRTAGVDCTFEAPPAAAPRARGGGASEAYVEARFAQVEDRLTTLETAPPPTTVAPLTPAPTSSSLVARNGGIVVDHERRIAALEAQVYSLQLSTAHPPPPAQQIPHNPYFPPQPQYATQSFSHFSGHSTTSSPPIRKPHYDETSGPCSFANGDAFRSKYPQEGVGTSRKRPKLDLPDAGEDDFLSRGVVTEEEATMCFESYFLTFAHPAGAPISPLPTELPPLQGVSRAIRLPFAETRARSPLLFATIISMGARSLSRFDTYQATLNEAIRLCHGTFLVGPGEEPTSLDLKGMMLLSLYNGMPDLMSHAITLSYRFKTPTALLEFEKMSEEDKLGKKGLTLVRRGRTFIVSFLWTSFYSYCSGQHGFYHIPASVIRKQLDILEGSNFSQQPSDRVIRINIEECLILRGVFDKLGPGMRAEPPSYEELFEIVSEGMDELQAWCNKWSDMMEMVTNWGDTREIKTSIPLHHGQMCLLMNIFRDMICDDSARAYPKMREFARLGSAAAIGMLRWGVESRIWLPHSMVAQYLHHHNIPTAVTLLYTTTRLFPEDAQFLLIRRLLHRLLKQCDSCINGSNGTAHEVKRAHETKRIALDFDRYAFLQGGEGPSEDVKKEEEGLFGEEITASLGAMGLEMNLWGGILEGALSD